MLFRRHLHILLFRHRKITVHSNFQKENYLSIYTYVKYNSCELINNNALGLNFTQNKYDIASFQCHIDVRMYLCMHEGESVESTGCLFGALGIGVDLTEFHVKSKEEVCCGGMKLSVAPPRPIHNFSFRLWRKMAKLTQWHRHDYHIITKK